MTLELTSDYKYISLIDRNGGITAPKSIISSTQINHELLSMMYGNNYDDRIIILDQISNMTLSIPELEKLSAVGAMQLSNELDDPSEKYEYRSLLNTINVTSINISNEFVGMVFYDEQFNVIPINGLEELYFESEDSFKLIISISSPNEVTNVSQELHNLMESPHNNMDNLILRSKDITEYNYLDEVIVDNINIQTGMKLFDLKDQLTGKGDDLKKDKEAIGDTRYALAIENNSTDENGELIKEYAVVINFRSKSV